MSRMSGESTVTGLSLKSQVKNKTPKEKEFQPNFKVKYNKCHASSRVKCNKSKLRGTSPRSSPAYTMSRAKGSKSRPASPKKISQEPTNPKSKETSSKSSLRPSLEEHIQSQNQLVTSQYHVKNEWAVNSNSPKSSTSRDH